jgi:hypothetical protein
MPFGRRLGPRPLYATRPNLLLPATRKLPHYRSDEVVSSALYVKDGLDLQPVAFDCRSVLPKLAGLTKSAGEPTCWTHVGSAGCQR